MSFAEFNIKAVRCSYCLNEKEKEFADKPYCNNHCKQINDEFFINIIKNGLLDQFSAKFSKLEIPFITLVIVCLASSFLMAIWHKRAGE